MPILHETVESKIPLGQQKLMLNVQIRYNNDKLFAGEGSVQVKN
uniref:Uncharacterized protein n=1 Tax=Rheinheimera sp. BAL341 TaxID=1708203 RepID=A0A486XWT0_9GAMM